VTEHRTCPECGTAFSTKRRSATFCCREHADAFMNRKKVRGATLIELYMHHRYNRGAATRTQVLAKMNAMVAAWRALDKAAGRQSMLDLDDIWARLAKDEGSSSR
jgi:predicted nucleic acid-binding Zn ribbon protein